MVTVIEPPITVISGAASGIGRATAIRLAARGDHVALVDIDERGLDQTASEIRASGGQSQTFCLDVRDRAAVMQMSAVLEERLGGITYAFSNAGVGCRKPVSEMALSEWDLVLDTHLTGSFHLCQAVLPQMVQRETGALVLTSSDFAIAGMRGQANYAAAKTALYSLTKALALEFAPQGIRVNAVGPGPIDTPLLRRGRTSAEWGEALRDYDTRVPMKRLGRPEEVASVVDFLLSGRAAYITGQLIQPNGGQVMW